MSTSPPGEISTRQAALLLGIGETMMRKLVAGGHIVVHKRGYTTLTSAVRGYADFLRRADEPGAGSQAAARQHTAKAATIAARTARQRAQMVDAVEADAFLDGVADHIARGLRRFTMPGLPPDVSRTLAAETAAAAADFGDIVARGKRIARGLQDDE